MRLRPRVAECDKYLRTGQATSVSSITPSLSFPVATEHLPYFDSALGPFPIPTAASNGRVQVSYEEHRRVSRSGVAVEAPTATARRMATTIAPSGEEAIHRAVVAVPTEAMARPSEADLITAYDVEMTAHWIVERQFQVVGLQFPDELLPHSIPVFQALRRSLLTTGQSGEGKQRARGVELYIMADTTYGSCCVDEVAAQHVSAEAVIHYGNACMSSCVVNASQKTQETDEGGAALQAFPTPRALRLSEERARRDRRPGDRPPLCERPR